MNSSSSLAQIQDRVLWPFIICTIILVIVLVYLIFAINENKLVEETKDDVAYGETLSENFDTIDEDNKLSKKIVRI